MLGAIAGDVIGSVREARGPCAEDFPLFVADSRPTDDSVLTVAVAEVILNGAGVANGEPGTRGAPHGDPHSYAASLRRWGLRYPDAGYGLQFYGWLQNPDAGPYQSYGNGSAMRVSPVAWAHDTLEDVCAAARRTAEVTHDHPDGMNGADAVAAAIFVARTGGARAELYALIEGRYGYQCSTPLAEQRRRHRFDATCRGTIPIAAACALESVSFEDAIRKAVSLGGDADTIACIAGSIAEGMYGGVPRAIADAVLARLPHDARAVAERFVARFGVPLA